MSDRPHTQEGNTNRVDGGGVKTIFRESFLNCRKSKVKKSLERNQRKSTLPIGYQSQELHLTSQKPCKQDGAKYLKCQEEKKTPT
jgi:hypothetical protein